MSSKRLQQIMDQLQPQIKNETMDLRMAIANKATYHARIVHTPYKVDWDGQSFYSDDTGELVDQVIEWLKKSKEERAKNIIERR